MLWYALCVVYGDLAVASHNRRRERKSSLSCQNFFFGIFSISGSLKPCICFPLVASVNMMRFFIIIFKYCILNEKPHSLNGLINWCYLLFLPHVLFFTHFTSFSLWFTSLRQLCSCIHHLMCFHVCGTAHRNPQCEPKSAMNSAQLTCVLGTGHWRYQGQDGEKKKVWLRSTNIFEISVLASWLTHFPSIYG